jgi:hypothetical protein
MSTGNSTTKPAAKPRSPVERAIVWGGIAILLGLVAVEFNWRNSHVGAYDACIAKIKATEEGNNTFKRKDVEAILGSKTPTRTEELKGKNISNGAKSVEIFTWPTLNPMSKRELYIYYGHDEKDPDVIGVGMVEEETTDKKFPPPTAEEIEAAKKNAPAGGMMPGGMMGGPGRPGGPGAGAAPTEEGADKPEGEQPAPEEKGAEEKEADAPAGEEKPADEAPADKPVEE